MSASTDIAQEQHAASATKINSQIPCLTLIDGVSVADQQPIRARRGSGVPTTYNRKRDSVYEEMATVSEIYLRGGEPVQDWHVEVGDLLARRYEIAGWSRSLFMQDWSTLRRVCGDRHPSEIFLQDLEDQVLRGQTQATRESYVGRMRSVFNSLRMLGVIPLTHRPDDGLPKIKVTRADPRPLSKDQVLSLIANAPEPMKEWFILAALTGMRAGEISVIQGSWLELHGGQYMLRIFGKGHTELVVPAHKKVVEIIQARKTLGRLYDIAPNYLSRKACEEMRRQGIMTKHNKNRDGSRLSFHSFRHFFATEMLIATKGNLVTTSKLMRHASPVVTMRYAGLINNEQRTAIDLLMDDVNWDDLKGFKDQSLFDNIS